MPKIFINFRSDDEAFAASLIDATMTQRFGPPAVFKDSRSIPLGDEFTGLLWKSLADAELMLTVIGRRWLRAETNEVRRLDDPDDFVRRELEFALSVYDPAGVLNPNDPNQRQSFAEGVAASNDSDVELVSLTTRSGSVAVLATVRFISRQDPGMGPARNPDETCTRWAHGSSQPC